MTMTTVQETRVGWISSSDTRQKYLQRYAPWITEALGVDRSEWVYIDVDRGDLPGNFPLLESLCGKLFPEAGDFYLRSQISDRAYGSTHVLQTILEDVEFHPSSEFQHHVNTRTIEYEYKGVTFTPKAYGDVLVKFRLKDMNLSGVYVSWSDAEAPASDGQSWYPHLIIRRADLGDWQSLLKVWLKPNSDTPHLYTFNGKGRSAQRVEGGSFDHLTLSDSVVKLAWNDVTNFRNRKAWFLKNHLPWKRGLLFHGAPGNGKTSIVKALMAHHKMDAYTLKLHHDDVNDMTLDEMFTEATRSKQSIVLFEDLDRAFPKTGERKTRVSLQALLNTLDGVATPNGMIVIATANEPTALDKAILERPGRFDRVVFFPNPDEGLRLRYLADKATHLTAGELAPAVAASEGFSFAQVQETYILAGQDAFERGDEEITVEDIVRGADTLRNSTGKVGKASVKSGFHKG